MNARRSHARLTVPLTVLATALALAPALLLAPAQAAPAKPKVSISVSAKSAKTGTSVRIAGKVSGRSAKARVVLQRKSGSKWVKVRTSRVKASKKYAFRTDVRSGRTVYRVKVAGNSRVRAAASRRIAVTGTKSSYTAAQRRILADTNAFRKKHGLAPLAISQAISKVATDWSRTMGRTGVFEHNPNYSTQIPSGWNLAGENIAGGRATSDVVDAWIASPGHRANLLGEFTHIGIGAVTVKRSLYTRYFTQVFANYPSE